MVRVRAVTWSSEIVPLHDNKSFGFCLQITPRVAVSWCSAPASQIHSILPPKPEGCNGPFGPPLQWVDATRGNFKPVFGRKTLLTEYRVTGANTNQQLMSQPFPYSAFAYGLTSKST